MAVTTLVLENNPDREERHAILLNAVREHLENPDLTIEYTSRGQPVLKGSNKYISVTTTEKVMVCAVSDTPVGIDGEHTGRFIGETRTDFIAIAERFFTEEESDFVREGRIPVSASQRCG